MFGPAPISVPPISDALLANEAFRDAFRYASDYVEERRGWSLWRERDNIVSPQGIEQPEHYWTQEGIYQASLFQALKETGVQYDAIAGISLGEIPAGHAAGVLSFDEFLHVVSYVIPAVLAATGGDLIAVPASIDKVKSVVGTTPLELILDWPSISVWALPDEHARRIHRDFRKAGIAYARLGYNRMSHTHHVDRDLLSEGMALLPRRDFNIPYYSTWKGGKMGAGIEGDYWMHMISEPASITGLWNALRQDDLTDVIYIGSIPADKDLFAALPEKERPTSYVKAETLLADARARPRMTPRPQPISSQMSSQEFARDPYSFYRGWLSRGEVHRNSEDDAWVVVGYDAISSVLRQPAVFSSDPFREISPSLFGADPPGHTRVRRIVNSYVTPAKLLSRRESVSRLASQIVASLKARGSFDASADLATALSVSVAADWIGLRIEHAGRLAQMEPAEMKEHDIVGAFTEQRGLLHDLADDPEFSPTETAEFASFLMIAGVTTVRDLLAFCLYSLLRSPRIIDSLMEDPSGIPSFVEEVLRLEPPVHGLIRRTTQEVTLGGRTIPAESTLWLMLAGANRDPAKFDRPDELMVGRTGPRHLSFGHGIHYCIGSHLGRLEAEVMIGQLLPDLATMAQPNGEPQFEFGGLRENQPGMRGMKSWTLAFGSQ